MKTDVDDAMSRVGWYPLRTATRRNATDADLRRVEARLGGRLPDDYRAFVVRYGQGGVQQRAWFPIEEASPWGPWGLLDQFLGFSTKGDGIEDAAFDLFAGQIPEKMLPIAYDPGGNLLLIAAEGSDRPAGSVWFWDHEHRPRADDDGTGWRGNERAADDNLYAVAASFTEFLSALRADPVSA